MLTLSPRATAALAKVEPIIVSNRGPVGWATDADGNGRVVRQEGGGLFIAMAAVAAATDARWVATAKGPSDLELARRAASGPLIDDTGTAYRMGYVTPSERQYEDYYSTIANPLLWFIQHHMWDATTIPHFDDATRAAWDDGYRAVNQQFADEAVRQMGGTSRRPLVMLQDYHLYLAPEMIRAQRPDAVIQQFIHIPWPEPGYFQLLPRDIRHQILNGILGNDIIGFQTRRDVAAFRQCCALETGRRPTATSVATAGGRAVEVHAYPISVDVAGLEVYMASERTRVERDEIASWRPEKLIVRVDRMDLSKNIVRGFLAYADMLDRHPEMQGRTQFLSFLQPTRGDIAEYQQYERQIDQVVADINSRFGNPSWQPIVLEKRQDMHRAVAAYESYDVLMVNAVRDGMNLVIKDGVICNQRDGAVILSTGAGAHDELGSMALSVDAFDIRGTADALFEGLTMGDRERSVRAAAMRQQVRTHDLGHWIELQATHIGRLVDRLQRPSPQSTRPFPQLTRPSPATTPRPSAPGAGRELG